jgi:hypothetical protein
MRELSIYVLDLPLLVVLISLVYSATRYDEWTPILHEAFRWGARLVGFLCAIAAGLYAVTVGGMMAVYIVATLVIVFLIYVWLTRS